MFSRIHSLASCLIILVVLLFAGSAGAQDVSLRCEAAIDRAAGHYSQCLLSADASYARHGNPTKLENRQARCETRFDRRTSRAIARHGADECTSTELVAALADRTVTCAEGVATEASGTQAPSYLFVQNGSGGTLSETILTLTDVSSKTGWFTDRPYRDSGQIRTEDFVLAWGDGGDSFADDPPNAEFSCEVDDETVNYVVELMAPSLEGTDLTYAVESVGDQALPTALECDSDSHLFIDSALGVRPNVGTGTLQTDDSSCQSYCGCYKGKERENGKSCQSATDNLIWSDIALCKSHTKDSCGKTLRHTCAWNVALFSVGDNSCAMSAPQYQTDEDRKKQKIADWNQEKNNECKSYCGCKEGKLQARMEEDDFGQQTGEIGLYCEGERYNAGPPPITALGSCTSHTNDGKNNCKLQSYCAWHKATQSDQDCSWQVIKKQ